MSAHSALCVIAPVIEAVIGNDSATADARDPDLPDRVMTTRRCLAEPNKLRFHKLTDRRTIEIIDRATPLHRSILNACAADAGSWGKASIARAGPLRSA